MKQKLLKLTAMSLCCLVVTAAYACWTTASLNCAVAGQTASLVITCSNSGGLTWTQTQTAAAEWSQLQPDYAVTVNPGPNYYTHTATAVCPDRWDYKDCHGQPQTVDNLTSYPTVTLAQDCPF
jgi:ABC-type glycerol-3-phosphate transport system substrate-binding protein